MLLDRYGSVELALLSAYNAGPAAVERAGGAPSIATLRYVKNTEAREPSLLGYQPRELVRRSDADVQVRNREVADLALEDVRRHWAAFRSAVIHRVERRPRRCAVRPSF